MNTDQIIGRIIEAEGNIKRTAGEITENESLLQKGKLQKVAGKAQAAYGDIKNVLKQRQ